MPAGVVGDDAGFFVGAENVGHRRVDEILGTLSKATKGGSGEITNSTAESLSRCGTFVGYGMSGIIEGGACLGRS